MNTLMITQAKNGYILMLTNDDEEVIDTRIAGASNTRGYGQSDLVSAIEDIFADNKPAPLGATCAPAPSRAAQDGWTLSSASANGIKEDSDKAAY